jgi:hypothetical protein
MRMERREEEEERKDEHRVMQMQAGNVHTRHV